LTPIALVTAASPDQNPHPEAVTYCPSGNSSMSGVSQVTGSANGRPFLYHGMEHESFDPTQFYYSGNGAYYSAQIMRSMSMTGAQGTNGPPGGPGPGGASLSPASSGGIPNPIRPESAGVGAGAGGLTFALEQQLNPELMQGSRSTTQTFQALQIAGIVGSIAAAAYDLAMFFDDIFSGGPDYPPNYFTFQHRLDRPHGGPHPLYTVYIGMAPEIVPGMGGFHPASAHGGPSIVAPLSKPEGTLTPIGFRQFRIVNMRPGPPIIVNNPNGSAAYMVTCHKNGTLAVDYFDESGGHKDYPGGTADVTFKGVRTTYVCHGYLAS
jgi:hypothetical protein